MKIYLADTIQRDYLGYNILTGYQNHLESYFSILAKKCDLKKWSIFSNREKENQF